MRPLVLPCAMLAAMLGSAGPARAQDARPAPPSETPLRERVQQRIAEIDAERERLSVLLAGIESGQVPSEPPDLDDRPRWERWRASRDVGPEPSRELTPEELDRAESFLVELVPEIAESLAQLRASDPRMHERMRRAFAPRALGVMQTLERDPALGGLQQDEFRAGVIMMHRLRELRDAFVNGGRNSVGFEGARARLREALAAQFDAKLALRAHELEQMLARVHDMREELERSRAGREAHLDQAVEHAVHRLERDDGPPRGPDRPRGEGPQRGG